MSQRIHGFDVARALAVFGMVVVNFKIATGADKSGPHWLLDAMGLLEGRAAATFVVLAGVGLSLLSARAREANDTATLARQRNGLLRRALFLFVVGLLYTPIWPADILHFYGVYLTLGALLLAAPARWLVATAAASIAAFVGLLMVFDYEQGWDWETLAYEGLWTPEGMIRHLFFNGFHPVFPWVAFLLLGMFLGRLPLRDALLRRRVLGWGLGVAVATEAVSWLAIRALSTGADARTAEDVQALFGTAPMPPVPFYVLAAGGLAAAVIAACVGLSERAGDAAWLQP
ncbi:MAG: heparan-alpha-glucosaminide N-acetyltransferase domain-containing protein, partial [Acidobacteriota bacterium]